MKDQPTLLLVPGLACDGDVWADPVQGLTDLAYCHIADITQADSIAAMADAVLADAPPLFALAGHSLGGYVSFEIFRRVPRRVTKLALIGTSARPDTAAVSERRRRMIASTEAGAFEQVVERLLPSVVARHRLDDAELIERVRSMIRRVGAANFCRQQRAIIGRADSRPDLARITIPTLIAAGDEDVLMPSEVQAELADGIPGARRVTIERCGHMAPLENPEPLIALLREWLVVPEC